MDIRNGDFLKYMSPVYDEHGLVLYYQRSGETYDKGSEIYDRNGILSATRIPTIWKSTTGRPMPWMSGTTCTMERAAWRFRPRTGCITGWGKATFWKTPG